MDPVCSTARLTTLILRPSQKRVRVLLGGGAAEKLPKMGQQPEASPARTVMLYGSALTVVGVVLYVCPSKYTVSLYCRPAHAQLTSALPVPYLDVVTVPIGDAVACRVSFGVCLACSLHISCAALLFFFLFAQRICYLYAVSILH